MKYIKLATGLTALLISVPGYAFFGLGSDSDSKAESDTVSSLTNSLTSQITQQQSSPLVDALTSQLSVSPEQATGGAGALLALASNSLSGSETSELTSLIPGMSSLQNSTPGLLSMATNMSAVNNVFSTLGLDPAMVSQFAPVILQYLTGQGASSGLIGSLTNLWQ